MENKTQARVRSPLTKRVFRDMLRDHKRYIMIFLMLVLTIGFVSGIYVANYSMMTSLEAGAATFHREDGHFLLSGPLDEGTLSGIATGELADVVAALRERAYDEARGEVEAAVAEGVAEAVREEVRAAIRAGAEAAVNAELDGIVVTEEERRRAVDEAVEKALAESFDGAFAEALDEAMSSSEYDDALSEAWGEAKAEIDRRIDEECDELSDRYELDGELQPVPVTVRELFYKERPETFEGRSDYEGTIRVYGERREVDLYDLIEGRAPGGEDEIVIDRMHADNVGIEVGDTINVGDAAFRVVGLASFVDYTSLYKNNTDTIFDALTFDVAMTTDEGFERIDSEVYANYAFTYERQPEDEYEEKELSERFLKSLVTHVAAAGGELEIRDYVPAYMNQAIIFAPDDMGSDKTIGGALLYILTAVMAFIFAVSISATLEAEAPVIGTLRSSGYTKAELLRYYMSAPIMIVALAAVVGNALGYTVFKNIVVGMYYNSYSLPTYKTLFTPEAFIKTTLVPTALMAVIDLFVIMRALRLSPLRFLRRELRQSRKRRAVRLPNFGFFSRFRMRVITQNIPAYVMLFCGITFVMLLLSMAVGMPSTLRYYQDSITEMMFVEEQVILNDDVDGDGKAITTDTPGAERFSLTTLVRRSDIFDEEVSVYGVSGDSSYIKLDGGFPGEDADAVFISRAYADKYGVREGDIVVLSEKYERRDYTFTVCGIYEYSAGIAVFMSNARFNSVFEREEGSFSGYMANEHIADIDEKYVAKTITSEDVTKMARQLDHSMGDYMLYFQYACAAASAIILYLLTKLVIEKNERSISMAKILGYSDGEVASLYLIPTAIVVFLSEFLAIYIGYVVIGLIWHGIMMELGGWFAFVMTPGDFAREFVLVLIAYLAVTVMDFFRIRKIPTALALKNME